MSARQDHDAMERRPAGGGAGAFGWFVLLALAVAGIAACWRWLRGG